MAGGTLILISGVSDGVNTGEVPSQSSPPASPEFVLQSYVVGSNHRCQLFVGNSMVADAGASLGTIVLPQAKTVVVQATNKDLNSASEVALDYLRIFQ